jgi:cell division protein ZapA
MADKPALLHVEIFGQTYAVRAGADPGYLESLAAFVDAQMKDVSRSSGAVDSVRIAVLAALNLADELFRARRDLEDAHRERDEARARAQDDADERFQLHRDLQEARRERDEARARAAQGGGGGSSDERVRRLAKTLGAALGE